jgi:hypothetical protein
MGEILTTADIDRLRENGIGSYAQPLLDSHETLRTALADLQARYDVAEFWKNWVYPEGATAEEVQAELSDYHMVLDEVAKVYGHVTGGKISKQNTCAEAVIAEADDYLNEIVKESVDEAVGDYRDLVKELLTKAGEHDFCPFCGRWKESEEKHFMGCPILHPFCMELAAKPEEGPGSRPVPNGD